MKENMFTQIQLQKIAPTIQRVTVKQNNWIAGEIDTDERIFYSVPRSTKSIFHLYHGDEGGLGINEEILNAESFDIVKIKFHNRILTTTRRKWLAKGILSKYCNSNIDRQIILKLSDINLDDAIKYEPAEIQQELFMEVI